MGVVDDCSGYSFLHDKNKLIINIHTGKYILFLLVIDVIYTKALF